MRETRNAQASIFDTFASHELGRELAAMSRWLDEHPELSAWVEQDLREGDIQPTGRRGLSAESALRCALLKQHRQLSYEELAFHVQDSASFGAFARVAMMSHSPSRSTLQRVVSAISDETWERINTVIKRDAKARRVEYGRRIRIDSTATDAPIHPPTDSALLWDSVRVLVRLLKEVRKRCPGFDAVRWSNHSRAAKKTARRIEYTRGQSNKARLYRQLLKVVNATLGYAEAFAQCAVIDTLPGWSQRFDAYKPLIERIIFQTEQRVFAGQALPASHKVVSLFEPHTDIINKGGRATHYGHKLNLVSGASGLILDVVIEQGNPADSQRFVPMLQRHLAHFGQAPRQLAADGGYASQDNLRQAKELGVTDVAFHKKGRLRIEDMVKSQWVYRRLRNFRAGIEAGISWLKRSFGLGRCTWKGLEHFRAYIWSSVVAFNLALLARHLAA